MTLLVRGARLPWVHRLRDGGPRLFMPPMAHLLVASPLRGKLADGGCRVFGTHHGPCVAGRWPPAAGQHFSAVQDMSDEFDTEKIVADYRGAMAQTGEPGRARDAWALWQAEDSLHEMALGEPAEWPCGADSRYMLSCRVGLRL
jgi:hypothetical protein